MKTKQILGLVGASILFLGVFAPIVRSPLVGSQNYFQNGRGDGAFIMIFAVLAAVAAITKYYKLFWISGVGSICLLALTFLSFQARLADARSKLEGSALKGMGDWALGLVQLEWGLGLLFLGATLVVIAAIHKEEVSQPPLLNVPPVAPRK